MSSIQLVFVGLHAQRLIESIRMVGGVFDKIVLVKGEDKDIEGEGLCWETTNTLEKALSQLWKVEVVMMSKLDVLKAISQILGVIKGARDKGDQVVINASGSMRTLAIAGYFAACITSSRFFTVLPKYGEDGKEIGAEKLIPVPLLPVTFPGEEQLALISAIGEGVETLDDLVIKVNPSIVKDSQDFRNERSRISHHLSKLEESNFIAREKKGRNIRIKVSELGSAILN
nr:DUF6293 family protein [Candidatus Sigynarchaeota archaeon]